jgi:hypothetical protein
MKMERIRLMLLFTWTNLIEFETEKEKARPCEGRANQNDGKRC